MNKIFFKKCQFNALFFLILFFIGSLVNSRDVYPQTVEIASRWKSRPIVIDGKDDDWQDSKISVGPQKIVLSLVNDESYLYFYVYCWDKELCTRILLSGFTVWFNRDDAENRIGIHYPIGIRDNPITEADKNISMPGNFTPAKYFINIPGQEDDPFGGKNGLTQEQFLKKINDMLGRMEIVGADSAGPINHYLSFFKEYGIECMIGDTVQGLIYELKLPLVKSKSQIYGLSWNKLKNLRLSLDLPFAFSGQPMGNKEPPQNADNGERPQRGGGSDMPPGGGPGGGGMDMGGGGPGGGAGPGEDRGPANNGSQPNAAGRVFPEVMNVTLGDKK